MAEFAIKQDADFIYITLPKENLVVGIEAFDTLKIVDKDKFFNKFERHFFFFDEDEEGNPAFARLLDELAEELAVYHDAGIDLVDWEEEFDNI